MASNLFGHAPIVSYKVFQFGNGISILTHRSTMSATRPNSAMCWQGASIVGELEAARLTSQTGSGTSIRGPQPESIDFAVLP
jgi:hypothetical protein